MPIYDRNKDLPDREPSYWLDYVAHGERVRESANTKDAPRARALLKIRLQELDDNTWLPANERPNKGRILFGEYFRQWHDAREELGVQSADDEHSRMSKWVLPTLGDRPLENIRRRDLKSLITKVRRTKSKTTGELLANRSIHRIYEVIRQVFRSAVEDELITATPATLRVRKDELPKKTDKDPHWRSTAVFAREEVEQLIRDERIPLDRRVLYTLLFLTGARFGEIAGLKWGSYDDQARPLGRIVLATQYEGRELKTGIPREVPVHPTLAVVLETWRREGWASIFKRAPKADDWVVPRPTDGKHRIQQTAWNQWSRDLSKLGLRHRRIHDTRRTVVTLARADGAREDLLQWVTHGPSGDRIMDVYTSPPWASLCAQINCLDVQLLRRADAQQPAEPEPRIAPVRSEAAAAKEDLRPPAATPTTPGLQVEVLESAAVAHRGEVAALADVRSLTDARSHTEVAQPVAEGLPMQDPQQRVASLPEPDTQDPAAPITEVHVPRVAEVYRLRPRNHAANAPPPGPVEASGDTVARSESPEKQAHRHTPQLDQRPPPPNSAHVHRDCEDKQHRPPQVRLSEATVSTWGQVPSGDHDFGLGRDSPRFGRKPQHAH